MGIIVNHPAGSIDFPELLQQLGIIKKGEHIKLPGNAESMPAIRGYPSIALVNDRPHAPGLRNAAMSDTSIFGTLSSVP